MGKFIVDKSFWELFPDAVIGVILIKEYKSEENSSKEIRKMLRESNEEAFKYLTEAVFSENKVIKVYRDAYQKFKTKKKARCCIEALLKRVEKDNPVSTINPLVDIYNSASLKFGLPVGAEDLDRFEGDLKLTITEGGDQFKILGEEKESPTLEGELCYKDDKGAVCRCFNWRDGERTMITENTKNAFVVSELIDIDRKKDLEEAISFIAEKAEIFLEPKEVVKIFLTKDFAEVEF